MGLLGLLESVGLDGILLVALFSDGRVLDLAGPGLSGTFRDLCGTLRDFPGHLRDLCGTFAGKFVSRAGDVRLS